MQAAEKNAGAVLIVDDKEAVRAAIRWVVPQGREIQYAATVEEARQKIADLIAGNNGNPLTVVTDWNIGKGCGSEVVRAAREAGAKKVIVVSAIVGSDGGGIETIRQACAPHMVDAFFPKPFDAFKLAEALAG